MMNIKETFVAPFEKEKDLTIELEELRAYDDRRELLQQHLSELFEKSQEIENKYPSIAKYDAQHKYISDRSFLTPEDKDEFFVLEEGMNSVKAERNELDREILQRRFEIGVKYLTEINKEGDVVFETTHESASDEQIPYYALFVKEWRAKIGNNVAKITMTGENVPSFFKGMAQLAEENEDTKLVEALKKHPQERELRFNKILLSFSITPKTTSRWDERIIPGVVLTKYFDSLDEKHDKTMASLPMNNAYSFPKIKDEKIKYAETEMIALGRRLGIESL